MYYKEDNFNADFIETLDGIQSGMYRMVVERIVAAELPKLADSTTRSEKKICVIGLDEKKRSFF